MKFLETLSLSVLITACGTSPSFPEGPMSDFSLEDTNLNSSTFEQEISPRDYIGSISGWYFGHGT